MFAMLDQKAHNLMSWWHRGKLSSRGCINIAKSLQHRGLDLFQLSAGVAILHVGDCDAEAVRIVIQIKLLQCLQGKESLSNWFSSCWTL